MATPITRSTSDTIVANENEIQLLQVESDLAETSISELVAKDLLGGDDAELLQRLSSADSMAQGMEFKIGRVLQSLDELLALLGAEETSTTDETPTTSEVAESSTSAPDVTKTSSGSMVD